MTKNPTNRYNYNKCGRIRKYSRRRFPMSKNISRRDFLKGMGAASLGLAVAPASVLAEGRSIIDAVGEANAAAAISVTRMGAQPAAPTREEVKQFRRKK